MEPEDEVTFFDWSTVGATVRATRSLLSTTTQTMSSKQGKEALLGALPISLNPRP